MTTIAALQCVERGLFSLDEHVSILLPELNSPDILAEFNSETGQPVLKKATKNITLRQLLTHTSGLGYDFLSPLLKAWRDWTKVDPESIKGEIVSTHPFTGVSSIEAKFGQLLDERACHAPYL